MPDTTSVCACHSVVYLNDAISPCKACVPAASFVPHVVDPRHNINLLLGGRWDGARVEKNLVSYDTATDVHAKFYPSRAYDFGK